MKVQFETKQWRGILALTAVSWLLGEAHYQTRPVMAQSADLECPKTSTPESQTGEILQVFAADSNSGVTYDDVSAQLQLNKEGGLFQSTNFNLASDAHGLCTADFDGDGWVDIISSSYDGSEILLSKNLTYENQQLNPPDWDDPNYVSVPKFSPLYYIVKGCVGQNGHPNPPGGCGNGNEALSCGDFNNDGNNDFMFVRQQNSRYPSGVPHSATMYLGDGNGNFALGYEAAVPADFKYIVKSTTMLPIDYNGDGFLDLVVGGASEYKKDNKGRVQLFLSNGDSTKPSFVKSADLVTNSVMGTNGINTLAYDDFNGDGYDDLIITSTHKKAIHMFPGLASGGLQSSYIDITGDYPGAAAMILAADFSLDGHADIVLASDGYGYGYHLGGVTHYYRSNGSSTPFTDGISQILTTYGNPDKDFDMAAIFQYDNDPDGTPDMIIANGNNSNSYRVFANRTLAQYTSCGEVVSGVLDLGDLDDVEMVVTAARLTPTMVVPGGTSVQFYLSNESPVNWQLANTCVDDSNAYCATFAKPVGRDVRWKAVMCSNTAKTITPSISAMNVGFDYTEAKEHYRAGVVVDDGVAYVGAFRQPGNEGHFYALNAGLGDTYWDMATSINSMADGDRNIYTADAAGTSRLDFTLANAGDSDLQTTLGVVSTNQARQVIDWQRSSRFGILEDSRLGAIENSTPAVVGAPGLPLWYPKADTTDRQKMDAFRSTHANREKLVLFGSRDGALHAVRTTPTDLGNINNGTEAWAFIPAKIANGMLADYSNGTTSAYPDGSPTVADVILDDGEVHTVAIVSGGAGHRSVFALDITETIDSDTGSVIGPTPLWHIVPGGAAAGQALSKPVVARVKIDDTPKFYAIIATGIASDNPTAPFTKGRDVVAVDISTGAVAWQFQSECAVTSDIAIFETDDELEPGSPAVDGFIDRVIWADACGNVYKVNPSQNVGAQYIESIGSISTGHTDPDNHDVMAMFSTSDSSCALGEERPIVGTIGARPDGTERMVIFMGTGGHESLDPALNNDFYAIYADTGEIRGCATGTPEKGRVQGECSDGICEKFYGGVVVTETNVIATRARDPLVGSGTCEFGTSKISGFFVEDLEEDFSVNIGSATVSSLYGDGGALYFTTLAGAIVRIGTPRAANAGEDTANGTSSQAPGSDDSDALGQVQGWKVLN